MLNSLSTLLMLVNVPLVAAPPESTDLLPALQHAEWRVRDEILNSPFLNASQAKDKLQLNLEVTTELKNGLWSSTCTVRDLRGEERSVTLACCINSDFYGWTWWDDPERNRIIHDSNVYSNLVDTYYGYVYQSSQFPFAVISDEHTGLCLGVPLQPPRPVRLLYDADGREMRAEFDFGLSPIPEHFPSCADAKVIAFTVPAPWAFRQALARYYQMNSGFERRAPLGGTFLTKVPLDRIERPEDFGFAWHDFDAANVAMADADEPLGILSFIYREPQTNWRYLRGDAPRSYDTFLAQLKEDAEKGDPRARATLISAVERQDGRLDLYLDPIAWTKAAPFGCNADPEVRVENQADWKNKGVYELEDLGKTLGWDGQASKMDGVFYDSMEGWTNILNYRRDHWRTTRYPLTFDRSNNNRVCLSNLWGNYAFAKALAEQLRAHNQYMMGNGAFHFLWMFAPFVDIPGREYSWFENGKWTPVPEERFLFLRSMAYQRPCWILMNDLFEDASNMEKYFRRCLFYAVFPSMFHAHTGESVAYFWDPRFPNRDRWLFQKYVPLIRRLDRAGWNPVPYAYVEPSQVRVERYGSAKTNNLAFTLYNPQNTSRRVRLRLNREELALPLSIQVKEWLNDTPVSVSNRDATLELSLDIQCEDYAMITVDSTNPDTNSR